MKRYFKSTVLYLFMMGFIFPFHAWAIQGDADGNGTVDEEDARVIARYVAGQITAIPNPDDADATQDGKIDMEDAFVIAKWVTGETRIIVVSALNGSDDELRLGATIRIEVFEKFFPFNIAGGTVRIRSVSTGYDSGNQPLTFERDGRSLYYQWDTAGLSIASDYAISIILTDSDDMVISASKSNLISALDASQPDINVSLTNEIYKPSLLANVVDALCPATGMSLEFQRHIPNNAPAYPYLGPLGRGWFHSYDLKLDEFTDGRITLRSRIFQSNDDGTYQASPGDYGVLVRNSDGTFLLKEKDGLVYCFRSDLYLDYIQDLNENRITAIYDGSKHLVEVRHSCGKSFYLEYNAAGRISKLTDHANRVTTYEYDSENLRLIKVTDPAGYVTEYSYLIGNSYIAALKIVCMDSQGNVVECPSDLLDYRLETTVFPDGTILKNEYDGKARLTRQSSAWEANPVTYSYEDDGTTYVTDALGGTTTVKVNDRGQLLSIVDADGAQTQMEYDSSGNLTQTTDPLEHATQLSYDAFGNVLDVTTPLSEVIQYGYDLRFNKPAWITNPLGKTTSFTYDENGNLTDTTYPDGSSEGYDYDSAGNMVSNTDAAGNMTIYSYSDEGQMNSLQNALGHSTQFSYDSSGDLDSVTDAKGHVLSHTRDILGQLTQRTYPDGSHEDYEYDGAGKVISFTNRRGEKIIYEYDSTGRLEWKIYPSGKHLHFSYDDTGYLERVEDVVVDVIFLEIAYERDALHRITKVKVPGKVSPESYDISYAYDVAGNRTFMSYPDGYSLNYEYDAANRLIRISDASDSTIVSYEYDAAGRRTLRTLGNGTYTTYEYDDLDRLTLLVNYAPDDTVQSQFAYTYNAAGIRTSITTHEGVHNYTYDNTYQLTGVSYPDEGTAYYDFDEVGNRKSTTDDGTLTIYSTNDLDQYTQVGDETFGYDLNGNLTTRTLDSSMTTYGWDEDDRLVSVDKDGIHIDYRYDHLGCLVAKILDEQQTRYIWDGLDLIAEMDSEGQVDKRHIYGASINEVILVIEDETNYWAQQDGLGSVVGTTNDSGLVDASCSYDVYGNVRSGDLGPVPQRFAGMWWDDDAELYYVRARWYDLFLGRFISCDPILIYEQNQYSYVRNNITNLTDSLGLEAVGNIGDLIELIKWFLDIGSDLLQSKQGKKAWWYYDENKGEYSYEWVSPEKFNWLNNEREGMNKYGDDYDAIWWDSEGNIHYEYYPRYGNTKVYPYPQPGESGWVYFDWMGGWVKVGGICPTFIQEGQPRNKLISYSKNFLISRIENPWPKSLLRSDIPIFGVAYGPDFFFYRVEFGEGTDPTEWHIIEQAYKPQEKAPDFKDISWMQGDLDIRGNLATWNTGLKNWIHLPWHTHEDDTDLNGIYTIRLVVEGKDGETVEDRVTCEVGRVIAQCLPGIAISPDEKVVIRFPEQALTQPFRIYTILPLAETGEQIPPVSNGCEVIGEIYRIREPGDQFIKDVSLEFAVNSDEIGKRKTKNIGIGRFDTEKEEWIWLDTKYDEKSAIFSTTLQGLPNPKAIFALIYNSKKDLSSPVEQKPQSLSPLQAIKKGTLVEDTFEEDLGMFKQRDRIVGATLSRDNKATPDGSFCLKFVNENFGGNFSSTVIDQPFDIREYGTMSFDYRISPGVKIDFLLKVNGRWYNLKFTGDPVDFKHRDVNIINLGTIHGVLADDKWHSTSVDLQYLLRQKTRHTVVDEIIMANWDIGGYMKLEFGQDPRGATYYLDNFRITGPGATKNTTPILLVDDFNIAESGNKLNGASGAYATPGSKFFEASFIDVPPSTVSGENGSKNETRDRALLLTFDVTKPDAYGGYWTSIAGRDISDYTVVAFRMRMDEEVPFMSIGIRNQQGIEGKTDIRPYAGTPDADGWQQVRIPLVGLRDLADFSTPDVLFFSATYRDGSGKGRVWIDDLRFENTPFARVADFESNSDWTLLGGEYITAHNGAAAISTAAMKDLDDPENTMLRISYGGTIGRDYGVNGGFSYASWSAGLNGMDARNFTNLLMRVRGDKGGETPNIYLWDAAKRVPVRAKEISEISDQWQTIKIPLDHFAKGGIDLSYLETIEIVFEWEEQSGTIYVDNIRFEN